MKILITGASSGIGQEFARILSNQADELILVGRNEENLNKLYEELKNNCQIKTIKLDLSNNENCLKLFESHKDIDFLINNAGFGDTGFFSDTNLDKEIKMINTNITAYHILTKLYMKEMMKKDKGHILNVASIAGFMPGPLMTTYYATKSYVVRLSEGIKEELKRQHSHVKISMLCPGPVKTKFETNANVNFKFNGIDSKYVANYALNHLNRFCIIPTFKIKISVILMKILPSSLVAKIIYKLQSNNK